MLKELQKGAFAPFFVLLMPFNSLGGEQFIEISTAFPPLGLVILPVSFF